jgi:hypothetical protein
VTYENTLMKNVLEINDSQYKGPETEGFLVFKKQGNQHGGHTESGKVPADK